MGQLGRIERDAETLFGRADPELVRFEPGTEGNRLLSVVCSHVNVPPGKFAQSRRLSRMRGAKLFLNVRGNDWYQRGVGGEFASIDALIGAVGRLSEGFQHTHFIGHSMGAYLVLALAHSFDRAGQFLATSPEPVLGLPATRSRENKVTPMPGWSDLFERFGRVAPKTPGVTLFGGYDAIDALFLAGLDEAKGFYGQIAAVPHHHGVTEFLTARRHYHPLLRAPKRGLELLRQKGFAVDPAEIGSPAQFARFYEAYRQLRQVRIWRDTSLIDEDPDWANPGWQALRAEGLRRAGVLDRALEAAIRADQACPGMPGYIRERARALIALGDQVGAEALAREMAELGHTRLEPIQDELVASGLIAKSGKPLALTSIRALERARKRASAEGKLTELARRLLPHLAKLEEPRLTDAAFRVVVDSGLRRSALAAVRDMKTPGAAGLARRIQSLLPEVPE